MRPPTIGTIPGRADDPARTRTALRVVFVTAYYPPYSVGGGEESTAVLADALSARGHDVALVAPRLGPEPPDVAAHVSTVDVGLRLRAAGQPLPPRVWDRPLVQWRLAAAVARAARGADVVHCHSLPLLPAAWAGARRARVPIVATVRDLGGVCPVAVCLLDGPRVPADSGVRKLEQECVPRFAELYGESRLRLTLTAPLRFATARGRSRLLDRCDAVTAVGSDLGPLYAEAGLVRRPFEVLPNIAELDGERPPRREAAEAGGYALYAGKVSPGKGTEYLLRAVRTVRSTSPSFRLVVAGFADARWRSRLAAEDGVEHLGRVPRAQLAELYAAARFAVVPSIWPEPFPRSALEASVSGRAVVATTAGGIPDAVVDGETGILVPPRDADALAAAFERLWSDPELAARMGRAGERLARERFSHDAVCAQTEALYRRVVRSRSAART